MSVLRRFGALLTLALLTLGVPWGLLTYGHVERLARISPEILLRPDDGSIALATLAVIGWAAWFVFMCGLVFELVRTLSQGRWRVPRLGPAQALAAVLLAALVANSPKLALATPAPPPPVVATVTTARPAPTVVSPAPAEEPPVRVAVVQEGDSLIRLAEQHLGDGARWIELYELNRDRVADPDHIEPGWILRLPAAFVEPPPPPPPAKPPQIGAVAGGLPRQVVGEVATAVKVTEKPSEEPSDWRAQLAPTQGVSAEAVALSVGAFLAAGIVAGLHLRRAARPKRPIGRRFVDASGPARRLESLLAAHAAPTQRAQLDAAQRALAATFRDRGVLPALDHVRAGREITFVFAQHPGEAPETFRADAEATWTYIGSACEAEPCVAYPALAAIGQAGPDTICLDIANGLRTADPAVGLAIAHNLTHAPWSCAVRVVCVGLAPAGGQAVTSVDAAALVAETAARRRARRSNPAPSKDAAGAQPARHARLTLIADDELRDLPQPRLAVLDPDLAEAHAPLIVIGASVDGAGCVAADSNAPAELVGMRLRTPTTRLALTPFTVDIATAEAISSLETAASDDTTEPAPWWAHDLPDNVVPLISRPVQRTPIVSPPDVLHPTLRLLGPIDLLGARGTPPTRAERSCLEYCAWLLEHPGATASQMTDALIVAEGTRRSNMSRLRTWLGRDDEDEPYLPDAYSGRIHLHSDVSSDWQRLQILLGQGVNIAPKESLVAALDLVRGAPLADAAPTQWHWAEPLRSDMVATIRDIGARLSELALDTGDLDLVRWATARALAAAPQDELLIGLRIRAEHRAGNQREVERLALRLAAHARQLGVDLHLDTILLLQEVMEGHPRAQRISA